MVINGRLVNVPTAEIYPAEVAIKGDRIAAVGYVACTRGDATRVIDAGGRYVTPGLIEGSRRIAPGVRLVRKRKEQ